MQDAGTSGRQQAQEILRDRGSRFLDYLAEVAKVFATAVPRKLENSIVCVLSSELPDLPFDVRVGAIGSSLTRLCVRQVPKPDPVKIPSVLGPYISNARSAADVPKLSNRFKLLEDGKAFDEGSVADQTLKARQIRSLFDEWKQYTWDPWAKETLPKEQAYDLYQRLFRLYLLIDRDQDAYDLLFGHCILTWAGRQNVDYPLVLTRAHMVFNEDTGAIRVDVVAEPRMSVAPFQGTDLPGFPILQRLQDTFNDDPLDVWKSDQADELEQRILMHMGSYARMGNGLDLKPKEHPELQHGWCLLLRKRVDNQGLFYERLAKKLKSSDYLPAAFDTLFSDISVVNEAIGKQQDDGTADRLLMPLPSNEEQRRIARRLASSYGVTVQGPPGTGKSHTIVNLIAQLLAHGKRVLVTAEKTQALAVLQDKMPMEIRDCAVASIGTTAADTALLQLSVQRMQDSLTDLDEVKTRRDIDRLTAAIDADDERLKCIHSELVKALADETASFDTVDGPMDAEHVAQWLAEHADDNIIADAVHPQDQIPLNDRELDEYFAGCRTLSSRDIEQACMTLPDAQDLPTGANLRSLIDELDDVRRRLSELHNKGLDLRAIDEVSSDDVEALIEEMRQALSELRTCDEDWQLELGALLRDNPQQRQWLYDGIAAIQQPMTELSQTMQLLRGHVVEVPEGDPHVHTAMLMQWRDRVSRGKGIPRFLHADLRSFAQSVTIDAHSPHTVEELDLAVAYIRSKQLRRLLARLIDQTCAGLPVPSIDAQHVQPPALADYVQRLVAVATWWQNRYPSLQQRLSRFMPEGDQAHDERKLQHALSMLEDSVARRRERELSMKLGELQQRVSSHGGPSDSTLWRDLASALDDHDCDRWQQLLDESNRLRALRSTAAHFMTLHNRLRAVAPRWADALMSSHATAFGTVNAAWAVRAWSLAQATSWIHGIVGASQVSNLLDESTKLMRSRHRSTLKVVELSTRLHLKQTQNPDARKALITWLDATKRYGKGTGKNAQNYLATARRSLPKAMNAMPVWIMPLHKVMDNFDPAVSQPFDVIIVDESSQCDLLSVGVLALAHKAVIVGDDKQTTPTGAFKSIDKFVELQNRYIPDIVDKSLLTFDESLYSISNRVFQSQIMLREHFRCVPEIIDYCNRFYDDQIFPLRERTHPEIGSPLRDCPVADATIERRGSDPVNAKEAQCIADAIRQCCNDPHYDGMTFGVVVMMSSDAQQRLISDLIDKGIGSKEYAKRKVRVGNPPAFQGDERDVIMLSFITDASGPHAYAATRTQDAQGANVAASRARNQLWAFYSLDPKKLNPSDYRRGLIEYIAGHGDERKSNDPMDGARTQFEHDVIGELRAKGYASQVQSHYRVGRYDIDCVVTLAQGRRLAIECDGDEHKTEDGFADDVRKQEVLERLGWHFIRLSAPAFYLDRQAVMRPVWQFLDDLRETIHDSDSLQETAVASHPEQSADVALRQESELPSSADPEPTWQEPDDVDADYVGHEGENVTANDSNTLTIASFGLSFDRLIESDDVPAHTTNESLEHWIRVLAGAFIANEFPLAERVLRPQIVKAVKRSGIQHNDREVRLFIDAALDDLLTNQHVLRDGEGFLYPNPPDGSFRILRGRVLGEAGFKEISTTEIAFVCYKVLLSQTKWKCDDVRSILGRIYGFAGSDEDVRRRADTALTALQRCRLAWLHDAQCGVTERGASLRNSPGLVWSQLMARHRQF